MAQKAASPTAAPPSFYDNLPAGGDAQAGGSGPSKAKEKDGDGELLKGAQGIYRVAMKMAEVKDEIKPYTDKIKEAVKALLVKGLKLDPSMLEEGSGEAKPPASASASEAPPAPPAGGGAPPSQTDESHAA